jgi:hypothetical protein
MRGALLCFALAAACGPSAPPEDPADAERRLADAEYERLRAEEPESPMRVVRRTAYRPPQGCGQGPYTVRFETLGAQYGEDYEVYACSRHSLRGDYRVRTEGREDGEARSFGWGEPGNERCVASEAELARGGEGSAEGAPAREGRAARRGRRAARATEASSLALEASEATFERCPEGTHETNFTSHWFVSHQGPAIERGLEVTLEIWSAAPNDLDGALFVVEQRGVPDAVTADAWREYLDRYDAWIDRYREHSDRQVASGRSHYVDDTAASAEPPPAPRAETRPPRASENAEWIAGYWHRAGDWVWIAGFWRVPPEDVERELTVHAPRPPPRPREEARAAAPAPEAVWTSGYWQWDGAAYVWVEGAWRIPPTPQQTWVAPSWRAAQSGAVFVPGGWSLSIGR